jgi:hypothetical protein
LKQSRRDCIVAPWIHVDAPDVTVHLWHRGNTLILGAQRDFAANTSDESVTVSWQGERNMMDLRTNRPLGRGNHLTTQLDAVYPLLLSLTP